MGIEQIEGESMFRHRPVKLAVMMGLALLLAACGGEEPGELPTPFVLGGEETAEVDTPIPEPEDDTQAAADAEPEPTDEVAVPDEPGDADAPDESSAIDEPDDGDETGVPGPPLDDMPPPQDDAGPPGLTPIEILTDFSALSPADLIVLMGQLQALAEAGDDGDDLFVIVDEAGNEVIVELPPPIAQAYEGREVEVEGEIVAPAAGESRYRLLASHILVVGGEIDDLPPFLMDADDDVFAPGPRPVDLELDAELTALQAYDALVAALDDELDGWEWVELAGSRLIGWTVLFADADENLRAYLVEVDGSVWQVEPDRDAPLVFDAPPGADSPESTPEAAPDRLQPLEREQIVVDSDQVEQATAPAEDEDRPPFAAYPLLTLRVEADDLPVWIVAEVEVITIDATTPLD
jgi:hypothetical protein